MGSIQRPAHVEVFLRSIYSWWPRMTLEFFMNGALAYVPRRGPNSSIKSSLVIDVRLGWFANDRYSQLCYYKCRLTAADSSIAGYSLQDIAHYYTFISSRRRISCHGCSARNSLYMYRCLDVDVDVVCRRRLKASLPASKIQY